MTKYLLSLLLVSTLSWTVEAQSGRVPDEYASFLQLAHPVADGRHGEPDVFGNAAALHAAVLLEKLQDADVNVVDSLHLRP